MANGGHISCVDCTYNRLTPGKCDVFGIETSGLGLCRAFRYPGQSHAQARKKFPVLNDLKPGIVYEIDNSVVLAGDPRPAYRVVPCEKK